MNIVKVQFLRGGKPSGREYTYFVADGLELKVGDEVAAGSGGAVVTQVDVPYEEIAPFADRAVTITEKLQKAAEGADGETEV